MTFYIEGDYRKAKVTWYKYKRSIDERDVVLLLLEYGPVTTGLYVSKKSSSLSHYNPKQNNGIFEDGACDGKQTPNHSVLIVGYGSTPEPYWIVKNSWGRCWGCNGFFFISRGKKSCSIGGGASVIRCAKT